MDKNKPIPPNPAELWRFLHAKLKEPQKAESSIVSLLKAASPVQRDEMLDEVHLEWGGDAVQRIQSRLNKYGVD